LRTSFANAFASFAALLKMRMSSRFVMGYSLFSCAVLRMMGGRKAVALSAPDQAHWPYRGPLLHKPLGAEARSLFRGAATAKTADYCATTGRKQGGI
jgi:hypothetical protein